MVNVKRVLALILCAVMLFGVLPSSGFVMSASAASTMALVNVEWILYDESENEVDRGSSQVSSSGLIRAEFDFYKNIPEAERAGYTLKESDSQKTVIPSWGGKYSVSFKVSRNTYTLTLNPNNGGEAVTGELPDKKSVTYGLAIGDLSTGSQYSYEKDGITYILSGWKDDSGNPVTADTTYSVAGDSTVYAVWTPIIPITFMKLNEAGEWTAHSTSELTNGSMAGVTIPEGPARTGYTFSYWALNGVDGDPVTENTVISAAANAYPVYTAIEYDVEFDAKGGTLPEGTESPRKVTFGAPYGTLPEPTLDGHTFVKWTLEDGTEVNENTTVATAANHTLSANWQENKKKVTVTFDANGGTLTGDASVTVDEGTPVSDLDKTAERTGYRFAGWLLDGKAVDTITDDCELVASWTAKTYKLTLSAGEGAFEDGTTSKTVNVTFDSPYGTALTDNVPSRKGFIFSGWTLNGQTVSAEDLVSTAKKHTLDAKWVEAEPLTAKVVLKANGGAFSNGKVQKTVTVTGTYGNALLNNIPTLDAFIFDGWQDEDGNKVTENDIVATTEKHILYARWIPDGKTRIYWQFVDIGSGKVLIDGHTVWEATDRVGQTATFDLRKEDITDAENDAIEAALDGYRTANDETLERTVTLGAGEDVNTVQFRYRTIDTLPTIVYWTIENTDGDELRSGTEVLYFEDKDLGEEDLFYISNAGGIPAGYRLADDQENSEIITVGKENEVTFTVDASSRYTIVNWAFVNSDGDAVASGTWAEPLANRNEAGTRSRFYSSTIEEYIPQYYTMSSWQRNYARITLGEENFVSFRVTLSSNYTIVHWSVVNADGEFVDGDTEIWDTLQNHSGTRYKFSLDTVFEMPKGYQIADGTNDYQFITMGKENYVEFKIEQAPQQTIIKWFFVDGNGNTIESGKVTRKATANIGKKGTFSVSETTGIPTGYRLADGESRTKDIIKGQTNKVYFEVCELITTGNNLFDNFVNFFYSFLYR
ncbi:MAG: InlB B-repeat-containing protein [Faecousia sp.]